MDAMPCSEEASTEVGVAEAPVALEVALEVETSVALVLVATGPPPEDASLGAGEEPEEGQ
jgi:hypothetical protein